MGFFKDSSSDSNDFERHEIKTYQRKGDQVRSEYERLNPDGSVTKTVAYGDVKEGLRYRSFQMGVDGTVREVAPETAPAPKAVASQAAPARAPAPQAPPAPAQATQQRSEPRKAYAFVVEPKPATDHGSGGWRVRTVNLSQDKPSESTSPQPQKVLPWWYEPMKEAINDGLKEEKPKAIEPERKPSKRWFNWFDDDLFLMKPPKKCPFLSRLGFDNFDLLSDSIFDRPSISDIFSSPLLTDW